MEPHSGAEIGPYRLDRKVGVGAFGAVWSGVRAETGERLAFKVLLPAAAANEEQVTRFGREAELLARVHSPNVARMVDVVVDARFGVVLVMELIIGEVLSTVVEQRRFGVEEAVDVGLQLLAGVRDLHAVGVIHRDLKPHNVMISTHKGSGARRVVIVDLGLGRLLKAAAAKVPGHRSITPLFVVLGTLECAAPEQIVSARDVTERADIYAVGTILYRAVAGHYPFTGGDERELAQRKLTHEAPDLDLDDEEPLAPRLREIIAKATRRKPAERYATADEMHAELASLARDLVVARHTVHPEPEPAPRGRRSRRSSLALGITAIVALATASFALWGWHH
jgi:eukaryotic-like serine/threonine-protein kinase